jgi:hypothetical protein
LGDFLKRPIDSVYEDITPGTVAASKAIIVDAEKAIDSITITDLKIGASGSGVSLIASSAELNTLVGIGTTSIRVLSHTVTAGEQSAGTVSIAASLTVAGFICTILRAGKDVTNKAAISGSATNLVVATNSTDYVLTTNDIIRAIVWA